MATPKLRLVTTSKKFSTSDYQTLPMGVHISDGRYVAAGALITTLAAADSLPLVSSRNGYKNRRRQLFDTSLRVVTNKPQKQAIGFVAA